MEHNILERKITSDEWQYISKLHNDLGDRIREYVDALQWWNRKVNLISRDVSRETLVEHTRHSQCIALSGAFIKSRKIIDAGSGGGLPTIPLAIAYNDKGYWINDIVAKKMFAVNDMINKLSLNGIVQTKIGSIAQLQIPNEAVIITKHAFKINELIGLTGLENWDSMVFLKGRKEIRRELEGVKTKLKLDIVDLETDFTGGFYKGKAVVTIQKA